MNRETASTMQLTVIRGRKMPKEDCSAGKNFSISISRSWTTAAMVMMKTT